MTEASPERPEWARFSGKDLMTLARNVRAAPGDRSGALKRFLAARRNPVGTIDDDLIDVIDLYLKSRGEQTKALRAQVAVRVQEVDPGRWVEAVNLIHLYTICCHFGAIALGRLFRDRARAIILRAYEAEGAACEDPLLLRLVIGAAFEKSNLRLTQRAAANLLRIDPQHHAITALGSIGAFGSSPERKSLYPEDDRYGDFIRGRKVAVVGPAAVAEGAAPPALEDFGVVATMNAKGETVRDFMPAGADQISYYNGEQARFMLANGLSTPNYLAWRVLKKRSQSAAFEKIDPGKGDRSRVLRAGTSLMFNGVPNALQNVLFDLATFEPEATHVHLCDFMLSSGRQKGYFPPEWNRDSEARMKAIVRKTFALKHDPVSQFLFTKAIMKLKGTTADPRLTKILAYNEIKFSLALEKVYRVRR